mgnify:CR=1 FL=1
MNSSAIKIHFFYHYNDKFRDFLAIQFHIQLLYNNFTCVNCSETIGNRSHKINAFWQTSERNIFAMCTSVQFTVRLFMYLLSEPIKYVEGQASSLVNFDLYLSNISGRVGRNGADKYRLFR